LFNFFEAAPCWLFVLATYMQPFRHTILTRCGCWFHISCEPARCLCFVAKNVTHCLILISFSVRSDTAITNIHFQAVALTLIAAQIPLRSQTIFISICVPSGIIYLFVFFLLTSQEPGHHIICWLIMNCSANIL